MTDRKRGYRFWTTQEIRFLRENYNKLGAESVAQHLARGVPTVMMMAGRVGLTKKTRRIDIKTLGKVHCMRLTGKTWDYCAAVTGFSVRGLQRAATRRISEITEDWGTR